MINDGGEARAVSSFTPITALSVSVGKNNGTGTWTASAVEASVQQALDVGVVDAIFATGAVNTSATGQAVFSDAGTLAVGVSGIGDVNAEQAGAANGAIARGTGSVTIQGYANLTMPGDFDLG